MAIGFPTPLKGWRVFAGEVGTIVLGVLIALGAQEFVQSLHWKREVRETRKALDAELARDLAAYEYRASQRQCVDDRLKDIARWADGIRNGRAPALKTEINAPPLFAIRTAAWEVTDGEIAARIPIDAKMGYAGMYDAMRTFDEMMETEQEQWARLIEFQSSRTFAEADIRAIEQAARLLDSINHAVRAFGKNIHRFALDLDIRPEVNIEGTADPIIAQWRQAICEPLL